MPKNAAWTPKEAAPLGVGEVVVSEVEEGALPVGLEAAPDPVAAPVWLMLRIVRVTELVPLEAEPLTLALTLAEESGAWMVN